MKVIDSNDAVKNQPNDKGEFILGVMPENFTMQATPDGKIKIFYVEEEDGAQG